MLQPSPLKHFRIYKNKYLINSKLTYCLVSGRIAANVYLNSLCKLKDELVGIMSKEKLSFTATVCGRVITIMVIIDAHRVFKSGKFQASHKHFTREVS